ncbi:PREDICTED: ADP-ribosylation factor GTPase-activating protein AGD12-like isoform X1 [Ipomoea nil]|uniref:ADP-ribosylation factor GTPase-activating protein AGD12-like isoform X1 n=1 Tax=Ipomoea nil TaxID=35883 RepID=UPI000901A393|nr:PREDICTED: ADP-ribosylation factor GTPase-activating protein AGD12-like isoform X1 [Ipomoea nil]XP_019178970.1 PREDICTED: ADP-ribosylation factor GTPase-activating protein AGD12-like isoform X1 [Ipomoea nil]
MSQRATGLSRPSSSKRRLRDLMLQSENRVCADCGAPDPKWASANIGVFICLKCSGVHRSLGTHISKVLSVTLDEWSDNEIDAMIEVGGNASANSIYEAYIPEGVSKPGPNAGHDQRAKFIRSKYELQDFLKPSLRILSAPKNQSLQSSFSSRKSMESFRSSSSVDNSVGMVEFIGMLKVKVIKGTNLAIRDMLTSDPYVLLTLGKQLINTLIAVWVSQTVRTNVIKSNLNPVWNEELMLSVPQHHGALKLQVYDHDTFSADDIMGEAEVDIQPMLTSAMAFGDPRIFGDMQIGKWLKSHDNALIQDSTINIVDGKVKQEVFLKLQNVESGEIDLELEWISLDDH